MSSSPISSTSISRRRVLRGGAAAVAGLGAAGMAARPARASSTTAGPVRLRAQVQLVDAQGEQRFLISDNKPPVILNGKTYPAEMRGGPDDGSYIIFNDENESEKGGLIASSTGAQISFDYPTVQGVTLGANYVGKVGAASLSLTQMADPDIPIEELTPEDAPRRVLLGCSNAGDGSLLFLYDSAGRPRITLHVDGDDVPTIQILDADGNVVAQLPEASGAAGAKSASRRPLSGLVGALRRR